MGNIDNGSICLDHIRFGCALASKQATYHPGPGDVGETADPTELLLSMSWCWEAGLCGILPQLLMNRGLFPGRARFDERFDEDCDQGGLDKRRAVENLWAVSWTEPWFAIRTNHRGHPTHGRTMIMTCTQNANLKHSRNVG